MTEAPATSTGVTRSSASAAGAGGAPSVAPLRAPRAILWVVGFSVFVAADDLTVVSTMLRPIVNDLGLPLPDGLDDAAWIVNAYLIAFIAIMPIAGRISDVLGRRRTFVGAYACFLVGTIWIPLADTFGPFLVGRVLTAIGGGAMVPIALAVVGDVYPPERRARALGALGAIETMGWVWGPLYGAMLVRFLDWRWQFWLNIPLALAGMALAWWALAEHDRPDRAARVDWIGAALLTTALVSLNLALLGGAEVQSVTGLDQLTGGGGTDLQVLYPVAVVAGGLFVWWTRRRQRTGRESLIDTALFRSRLVQGALIVNFVVGAALVIAMVDVPLFVNAVEVDLERSATIAGWVLSALTAAMAIASYVGGRITERTTYLPPVLLGLVASGIALLTMGLTWDADAAYPMQAAQLALLGVGFGLTIAPTSSAVVDDAEPDARGAAAAAVMVVRLLGLSVGLSALTAWGLARFNALRGTIELPPLTDPGFEAALQAASADLTASSIAETFLATAAVVGVGLVVAFLLLRSTPSSRATATHADAATTRTETIVADTRNDIDHSTIDHSAGEPFGNADGPPTTAEVPAVATDGSADDADASAAAVVLVPAAEAASWWQRRLGFVLAAFAFVLLAAVVAIGVLIAQLASTRDELAATRADLERVEAGAALFASQVTGFQEQLVELSPTISAGLDEAVVGLEQFGTSTLEFDIAIDENVAIDAEVVIDRTVSVPINTTLPINEEIATRIEIDGPFGTTIPLNITVPVDLDVPIDLTVDIPINETVPVRADVPVQLDVPIRVDVSQTELSELTTALAAGLASFQDVIDGLGG